MAGNRYLQLVSGVPTQNAGLQSSAGTGSAGNLVALNSSGQIDLTMLPGPEVNTFTASESIAAGALINVWNSSGSVRIRNADNTDPTKQAHGFAPVAIASSASGEVYIGEGVNDGVSGLTIGAVYYLGTVGGVVTAPPNTVGYINQSVGVAKSATELEVVIGQVYIY